MTILAPFSPRAGHADKVRFIFGVYDMDGDGVVSREDLELILRQLAGASFRRAARWLAGPWHPSPFSSFTPARSAPLRCPALPLRLEEL